MSDQTKREKKVSVNGSLISVEDIWRRLPPEVELEEYLADLAQESPEISVRVNRELMIPILKFPDLLRRFFDRELPNLQSFEHLSFLSLPRRAREAGSNSIHILAVCVYFPFAREEAGNALNIIQLLVFCRFLLFPAAELTALSLFTFQHNRRFRRQVRWSAPGWIQRSYFGRDRLLKYLQVALLFVGNHFFLKFESIGEWFNVLHLLWWVGFIWLLGFRAEPYNPVNLGMVTEE
jgi:hypothetical protein